MCSTRESLKLAAIAAVASIAGLGCQSSRCPCMRQNPPVVVKTPAPLQDQPAADEATLLRNSTKSVAYYESGATEAWPTRWYYSPNPDYSTPEAVVVDSLAFLGQTASLPVTLIKEPPFKQPVIYAGDVIPPSYTANPPYPPEQGVSRNVADPDPLGRPRPPVAPPLPPVKEMLPPTYVPPPPPKPRPATKPVSHSTSSQDHAKTVQPVKPAPTTRPSELNK